MSKLDTVYQPSLTEKSRYGAEWTRGFVAIRQATIDAEFLDRGTLSSGLNTTRRIALENEPCLREWKTKYPVVRYVPVAIVELLPPKIEKQGERK